jgi:hypothetical protein
MSEPLSERRLAENEVVFRQHNERIQQGFDELDALSKSEGYGPFDYDKEMVLHFYCECSDEKCTTKISLKLSRYTAIHKNRNHFLLVPGHEIPALERVVKKTRHYLVVEKFRPAPQAASQLYPTD